MEIQHNVLLKLTRSLISFFSNFNDPITILNNQEAIVKCFVHGEMNGESYQISKDLCVEYVFL